MSARKLSTLITRIILSLLIAETPCFPSFALKEIQDKPECQMKSAVITCVLPGFDKSKPLPRQTVFAVSKEAYFEANSAIETNNQQWINELTRSGKVITLPKGTVVFGIPTDEPEIQPFRVLSGPHANQTWYAYGFEQFDITRTYYKSYTSPANFVIDHVEKQELKHNIREDESFPPTPKKRYVSTNDDIFARHASALSTFSQAVGTHNVSTSEDLLKSGEVMFLPAGTLLERLSGNRDYKVISGPYAGQILWCNSPH